MTGSWIHRDADIHRCQRPSYQQSPGVKVGDRWRCDDCKTVWRVAGFDSGMQWDPFPTVIKWTKEEQHGIYGGIYAPGTK